MKHQSAEEHDPKYLMLATHGQQRRAGRGAVKSQRNGNDLDNEQGPTSHIGFSRPDADQPPANQYHSPQPAAAEGGQNKLGLKNSRAKALQAWSDPRVGHVRMNKG